MLGALICQRRSYERQSNGLRCVDCQPSTIRKGCFDITLNDTPLFPEGGGQPADHGWINDHLRVLDVQRRGLSCVHVCPEPLPVDDKAEVTVRVDWDRRWDHMQQHTGQHLISAVGDREFQLKTVSWALGDARSCVELAPGSVEITEQLLMDWERRLNQLIQSARSVSVRSLEELQKMQVNDSTESATMKEIRENKLVQTDSAGQLRWIDIEGVDLNMCCGTHVNNLSELQAIKLFPSTESVRGQNVRVFFLVGQRVLNWLHASMLRDRSLTTLLNCGPEKFEENLQKQQTQLKSNQRSLADRSSLLAKLIASSLSSCLASGKAVIFHYEDADTDFLSSVANALKEVMSNYSGSWLCMLAAGPLTGQLSGFPVLLCGSPADSVKNTSTELTQVMEVKGGFNPKMARWQGKTLGPWKSCWAKLVEKLGADVHTVETLLATTNA